MLAYRTAHVRFRTINDVKNIAGIGAKKFDRIRLLIEVSPDTAR
jgi:DNA uptake protein ComE-like DNA-binding protein